MVTYIEKMKSIRLSRERVVLLNSRKALAITFLRSYKNSRLPCTDILPEAADFCEFSAVKEIIERPSDAVVDLTDFELLDPKVGPMVRSWRKKIHKDLYGLTPDVARRKDENKLALVKGEPSALITFDQRARSHLELATSVFTCKKCTPRTQVQNPKKLVLGPVLSYPDVLAHRCFTREDRYASRTPEEKEDPSRKTCDGNWIRRTEWNNKQLSYDAKLVAIVSHFVTLVGLDPATTTTKEMDEMPYLLACCHCYLVEKAEFVVYGWRAAVRVVPLPFKLLCLSCFRLRTLYNTNCTLCPRTNGCGFLAETSNTYTILAPLRFCLVIKSWVIPNLTLVMNWRGGCVYIAGTFQRRSDLLLWVLSRATSSKSTCIPPVCFYSGELTWMLGTQSLPPGLISIIMKS